MAQRSPPSAAAALYPHLKSSDQAPKQQRGVQPSLAEALHPSPPKPDPHDVWQERYWELVGLRKLKGKR
jgi:hypothetical protein